jgi:hypothetical protein
VKIRKSLLIEAAKDRPQGYLKDVYAYVESEDLEFVYISDDNYLYLKTKYNSKIGLPGTELGPTLWRELFLTIESQSQLEYWESRIPNYQCGGKCKRFYLDWKKNNPPAFPLSFNWKWKLKNAVNAKLGQKIMSLDDAFAFWSSQRGNDV